jgi:hypothetical protein
MGERVGIEGDIQEPNWIEIENSGYQREYRRQGQPSIPNPSSQFFREEGNLGENHQSHVILSP